MPVFLGACPLTLSFSVWPRIRPPSYSICLSLVMRLLPPHSRFPPKKTPLGDETRPPPKPPRLYLPQEPTPEEMPVSGGWWPWGCQGGGGRAGGRDEGAPLCPEPLCPHSVPNAPTWSSGLGSGRLCQPQPPGTLWARFLSETLPRRCSCVRCRTPQRLLGTVTGSLAGSCPLSSGRRAPAVCQTGQLLP